MRFSGLVHFLHLVIVHFEIKSLIFIGDNQTLPELINVKQRLSHVLPTLIVSIPRHEIDTVSCPFCHPNQLSIIHFKFDFYSLVRNFVDNLANPMVVLRTMDQEQQPPYKVCIILAIFNFVIVDIAELNGNIKVWAWGKLVNADQANPISNFVGAEAIFQSNDTNALLFRKEMQHWPDKSLTNAIFITNFMVPFSVILIEETTGKQFLLSFVVILIDIIGKLLRYNILVSFGNPLLCLDCFTPLPYRNNGELVPLFDFTEKVIPFGCVIDHY